MEMISDRAFATFGQPDSLWRCQAHEGVSFSGERQSDAMRLAVANAKGANWHGELRFAPFQVRRGQRATIRFSAKAEKPIRFSVWIGQMHSPWASLVTEATHFGEADMTCEWLDFEHHAVIATDEDQARLNFVLGVIDNTIWVRGVSLRLEA